MVEVLPKMTRILFVEDDPVIMSNLRRVLSVMKRQWDMRFLTSGEEALIAMSERPFDVVVSDFAMPGINGVELLSLTQYQYPRVVRVLMCGADDPEGAVRGAGVAHRIIRKPCDPAELASTIQRALDLEQRLSDPDLQSMVSEVGALPAPSNAIVELNDVLSREDSTLVDVAAIVGTDANMTAKLLQVVNSAYFGLSSPISEAREAVAYLGMDAVRDLTVAMELMRTLSQGTPMLQSVIDDMHSHAVTVAHMARDLAPNRTIQSEAFVGGLLHDAGLLLIASQLPEKFLELQVQTMRCSLPLTEVEVEILGAHHSDIGAHLLDLWGLPHSIVEAVARHHDAFEVSGDSVDALHAVHMADVIVGEQADHDTVVCSHREGLDESYLKRLGNPQQILRHTV
jgi:HD-like signal output (HDOD) protein/CheY-like chemotaxis protein